MNYLLDYSAIMPSGVRRCSCKAIPDGTALTQAALRLISDDRVSQLHSFTMRAETLIESESVSPKATENGEYPILAPVYLVLGGLTSVEIKAKTKEGVEGTFHNLSGEVVIVATIDRYAVKVPTGRALFAPTRAAAVPPPAEAATLTRV